jgi:hypothetical protein
MTQENRELQGWSVLETPRGIRGSPADKESAGAGAKKKDLLNSTNPVWIKTESKIRPAIQHSQPLD